MAGVAAGSLSANRVAGRIRVQLALRVANGFAIAGAAGFMAADLSGRLNVVTVIAPSWCSWWAPAWRPIRAERCDQRQPARDRCGIGLYGFTQMAYGALCTVIVEVWRPGSVFTVAVVLLVSALLGQAALSLAVRRASA